MGQQSSNPSAPPDRRGPRTGVLGDHGRPIGHYLAGLSTFLLVGLLALRLISVASRYPYYFVWDMDSIVAQDCILLHSKLMPDHIAHPGFGAYLLLYWSQRISFALGGLSMLSLSDLAASLNPLVAMAEFTDFNRAHSPFIALGIAVLLWASLVLLFRPSLPWRLLSLGALGVQESLLNHSTMARSDLYAMFYWSVAVLFVTLSACYGRRSWDSAAYLFCAGVAAGLCFLTKMQSLFYVFSVPFLLAFALYLRKMPSCAGHHALHEEKKAAKAIGLLSLAGIVAFVLLIVAVVMTETPKGTSRWEDESGINAVAALFFLALAGLTVWQVIQLRRGRHATPAFRLSARWTILSTGFLASFLLHFALFLDVEEAFHYLVLDAKMLFGLLEPNPTAEWTPDFLIVAKDSIRYAPITFAAHGGAFLLLLFAILRHRILPLRAMVAMGVLSTLATFAVVLATRSVLRDLLWIETFFNFLTFAYLLAAVGGPGDRRPFKIITALGLAGLLVATNLVHNARMPTRIDANFNNYGWQDEPWLRNSFTNNQLRYGEVMDARYASGRTVAKRQAMRHEAIRRAVSYVFHNQKITHRNIGTLSEGYPLWTSDLDWRITTFPEPLREAIVIDNASLDLQETYLFDPSKVQGTSNDIDKFIPAPNTRRLGMLGRADLRVMLFVHADDIAGLITDKLVETGERISVAKGTDAQTFHGLEVWSYMAIPTERLRHPYFSLIQFRDPKLYFPYRLW